MDSDHLSSAITAPLKSAASLSELMYAGMEAPSPFMKDIFLVKQAIVGTRYLGGSDDLVEDLMPGSRVSFVAEPDNAYDKHAVMALDSQGRKLGYIPRHENRIIEALLIAGKVIYGIMPDEQPPGGTVNRHTPYSLWVDLYMREFTLPEDMTQIPRQGYQGSYAVVALELASEDEAGMNEEDMNAADMGEANPNAASMGEPVWKNSIRSIFAVKVINGEERDTFSGQAAGNTMEKQRELLQRFYLFTGYLPLVGHDMEERMIPVLEENYGVLLGIPFSNRVIDTKVMAMNHMPDAGRYDLDSLAVRLGIERHAESELEDCCRKIWKLYCRMERSEV